MLLLRSKSERRKDDVDWSGITDLAEVGGACTIPGFSEAVQEKEVKGWRSAWDCAADSEARESDAQCRRHSLVAITGSFISFKFILN